MTLQLALGTLGLLTPPPTYQGLKHRRLQRPVFINHPFNTPSNIPRIETHIIIHNRFRPVAFNTPSNIPRIETLLLPLVIFGDNLLTPPPTYQGLKPDVLELALNLRKLLTPPPTYQGLKLVLDLAKSPGLPTFNTPSNIPRIETQSVSPDDKGCA